MPSPLEQLNRYQSAPQSPLSVPPSSRHRWGLLVVFFALALALSAGAYFFLSEKYGTPDIVIPTYTPREIDPIAGWQTYTNTEYGFEFKYPAEWYLTEIKDIDKDIPLSLSVMDLDVTDLTKKDPSLMIILVGKGTAAEFHQDILKTLKAPDKESQVTIGGKIGYQLIRENVTLPNSTIILDLQNSHFLNVESDVNSSVHNQILSTFKFTR